MATARSTLFVITCIILNPFGLTIGVYADCMQCNPNLDKYLQCNLKLNLDKRKKERKEKETANTGENNAQEMAESEAFRGMCPGFQMCAANEAEPWNYNRFGPKGPANWGQIGFPDCSGNSQSPIDISLDDVVKDPNLPKLDLNYDTITKAEIENNGLTVEVIPGDGVSRTITVNGDTYSLRQFHFHWGCVYYQGSEHAIDGNYYAMEMHLVHYNEQDQIAVVGLLFQETDNDNEELQKLVQQLLEVRYKGSKTELKSSLNLNNLLPANPTSFYRYNGSLTTPGCSEGVTWSVVPNLVHVGRSQMKVFRKLYSTKMRDEMCKLANNYRPEQPLNGRTVYESQ